MSNSKILLQINGSIAAYKACELISLLVKAGHEVRVATSKSALQFVGPPRLKDFAAMPFIPIFGKWPNHRSYSFEPLGRFNFSGTSNSELLNRTAAGIGDDLLGTLFFGT